MKVLSDADFLKSVREKGEWAKEELSRGLADSKHVDSIQGRGLMMGIVIVDPRTGKPDHAFTLRIAQAIFKRGVLVEIGGIDDNVIRLLPALNIAQTDLAVGIEIIQQVILSLPFSRGL